MKTIMIFLCLVGYSSAQINDTIKNEIRIQQTLLASDEQNQKGNITGTVVDAVARTPISGAKVEILGTDKYVTTSNDGQYRILEVSKGYYQVQATAKGYITETQNNVSIKNGIEQQLFFFLKMNSIDPPDFVPVDVQPQPLPGSNPAPKYPELGKKFRMEGTIWLKLLVDEKGNASRVEILQEHFTRSDSIGLLNKYSETEGKRVLKETYMVKDQFIESAKSAARSWKFSPALLKGNAVKVWVSIPFKFKLDSPHKEEKK